MGGIKLIGQHKNLMKIQKWIKNDSFPRFLIIEGIEGSGRLTFAKEIVKRLNADGIISSNSIDSVRQVISQCYFSSFKTVYIFLNVDDMSVPAKNALLKVVEEPPNNAYFVMTTRNANEVLPTIKSRATTIQMEPYKKQDLEKFTDNKKILDFAQVPGDCKIDVNKLNDAKDLAEKIYSVVFDKKGKGVDILRLCTELESKKDSDDGVDVMLLHRWIKKKIAQNKYSLNPIIRNIYFENLSSIERDLNNKSINNKSAMESFLLKIFVLSNEVERNQNETN